MTMLEVKDLGVSFATGDGTVNAVNGAEFDLNIIPQTTAETIFADYTVGTKVNLEVDVIARYLERLLQGDSAAQAGGGSISEAFLAEHGFAKGR